MAVNRDEVLMNFQAMTDIMDVGECITYLDASDWDLQAAVNSALARGAVDNAQQHCEPVPASRSPPVTRRRSALAGRRANILDDGAPLYGNEDDNPWRHMAASSSSSSSRQLIEFTIVVKGATKCVISISESATVGDLMERVRVSLNTTGRVTLRGWPGDATPTVNDPLSSLHLPKFVNLLADVAEDSEPAEASASAATQNSDDARSNASHENGVNVDFTPMDLVSQMQVVVVNSATGDRRTIWSQGDSTVAELKERVCDLLGLTDANDLHGWPVGAADDTILAALRTLNGSLELRYNKPNTSVSPAGSSAHDEWDDLQDEPVVEGESLPVSSAGAEASASGRPPLRDQVPLVPDDFDNVRDAQHNLATVFESRYGVTRPNFFLGTLEDAVREAFDRPNPEDRRPLAIYLHDDTSIGTHVFCQQRLCSTQICNFLNGQFVIWAWDVTFPQNRSKLEGWLEAVTGQSVRQSALMAMGMGMPQPASYLRSAARDRDLFPMLLLFTKDKLAAGQLHMANMVRGTASPDELMEALMQTVTEHQEIVNNDINEQLERKEREAVRTMQEEEYQASLEADRQRQRERSQERQREMIQEQERQLQLEDSQRRQAELLASLPVEPAADCTEPMVTVRLRGAALPQPTVERRFLLSEPLSTLLTYVASLGCDKKHYRLLTAFPKKDLTDADEKATLAELGLNPREQLHVEERPAN